MLGNPGKIVGMMQDPKTKRWVFVEAAAGMGEEPAGGPSPWPLVMLLGVGATCWWLWNHSSLAR